MVDLGNFLYYPSLDLYVQGRDSWTTPLFCIDEGNQSDVPSYT